MKEVQYCKKCGNELKDNDLFCNKCGTKIKIINSYNKPKLKEWQKILIAIVVILLVVMGIAKFSDWSDKRAVEKAGEKWVESVRNNK